MTGMSGLEMTEWRVQSSVCQLFLMDFSCFLLIQIALLFPLFSTLCILIYSVGNISIGVFCNILSLASHSNIHEGSENGLQGINIFIYITIHYHIQWFTQPLYPDCTGYF